MGSKLPFLRSRRSTERELTRKAVQEFARSIVLIVEPRSLEASIAARIQELFKPDRVLVFELDLDQDVFSPRLIIGYEPEEVKDVIFTSRDRLVRWLQVNETSLVVAENVEVCKFLREQERQVLDRLTVRVVVPLVSLNRLTGMVFLSSTDERWRLAREDLELLETMGRQAGLALENSFLYREQRDRLQRLYRAERLAAAGQLAASLAHEIRNPLAAIRSTIQYLLDDYREGHPKRELVDELLNEVDRINRTLTGLLTLSRTNEAERVPVNLVESVEHALTLVATQARRQTVAVERRFTPIPLTVMGDASELRQLFLNLFLNSLQAMPEGGTLAVEVGWALDDARTGPRVEARVRDSGCGIPPENLDKIFDPFFTTKRDGTGLGLSVCHRIVERHEGDIQVQSVVGEGTAVIVKLPLLQNSA